MAKFWSLLALAILYDSSVSALPTAAASASSASSVASSVPVPSNGLSLGNRIGLGFGAGVGIVALLTILIIWYKKILRHGKREQIRKKENPHLDELIHYVPWFNPEMGLSDICKSEFMAKPEDVFKSIKFVNLYGGSGILLRELLMLASIRYLRSNESSEIKRASSDGKAHLEKAPDDMNFLQSFALNATGPEALVALRDDLVSQGLIIVRRQSRKATQDHENWATDGQVWIARPRQDKLSDTDQRDFYEDLIDIFNKIPDEGIPCIKRRRMELF